MPEFFFVDIFQHDHLLLVFALLSSDIAHDTKKIIKHPNSRGKTTTCLNQ